MMDDITPPRRDTKKDAKIKLAAAVLLKPPSIDDIDANIVLDNEPKKAAPQKAASGNFFQGHFRRLKAWWSGLNRNTRFAIIAGLLLIFGSGSVLAYSHFRPSSSPSYQITKKKVISKTVASPLTGVQVAPALAARPVTGIMIENSTDARPQSGLQAAGIVYEAIAEAGITRFLTLFQDSGPQYIGPVRSLRPYYIDFAAPYQASIVHVGGSPDALSVVQSGDFRNLDQFANGSYFTRVSSRDAPHNVYTSFAQLDSLNTSKGYTSSKFTGWDRKKDQKLATPTARTVDLAISSSAYYAHYDYDAASNSYLRSEGGAPHLDLVSADDRTGVQLKPKVVIALIMPQGQGTLDASGAYYTTYTDYGSGTGYVFQDGGVSTITWTKAGTSGPLELTDNQGHGIKLNAGQTWVTILGDQSMVKYTP